MGVLAALASALAYGLSDFAGGLAARRMSFLRVAFLGQVGGLVLVGVAALFASAGTPGVADLLWGGLSGLGTGLAMTFLFRGMSRGAMSVVVPVSSAGGAAIPVLAGAAFLGDRPSAQAWLGIIVTVPSLWAVSHSRPDPPPKPEPPHPPPTRRASPAPHTAASRRDPPTPGRSSPPPGVPTAAAPPTPGGLPAPRSVATPAGPRTPGDCGGIRDRRPAGTPDTPDTAGTPDTADGPRTRCGLRIPQPPSLAPATRLPATAAGRARRAGRAGGGAGAAVRDGLVAGVGIAVQYLALAQSAPAAGLWPVAAGRVTAVAVVAAIALTAARAPGLGSAAGAGSATSSAPALGPASGPASGFGAAGSRWGLAGGLVWGLRFVRRGLVAAGRAKGVRAVGVAVGVGGLAGGALVCYLLAVRAQALAVAVVLSSLYPVVPVVLGLTVLRERAGWLQGLGLVGVLAGSVLIGTA